MPCDSSYLDPTSRELELKRAARLLVYVLQQSGLPINSELAKVADKSTYAAFDYVPTLCRVLGDMDAHGRDRIIYNARDKTARDLADWWEEHQEADRQRKAIEESAAERSRLRASARSKLTKAEFMALTEH